MVDIYFDGGTDGMQICCVVDIEPTPAIYQHKYEKSYTNNELEYLSVLYALKNCPVYIAPDQDICLVGDSEVIIKQLTGEYSVKAPNLQPLHAEVMRLVNLIKSNGQKITYRWVPRELNKAGKQIERSQRKKLMPDVYHRPLDYKSFIRHKLKEQKKALEELDNTETHAKVICIELLEVYLLRELTQDERLSILRGMLFDGIDKFCKDHGIVYE